MPAEGLGRSLDGDLAAVDDGQAVREVIGLVGGSDVRIGGHFPRRISPRALNPFGQFVALLLGRLEVRVGAARVVGDVDDPGDLGHHLGDGDLDPLG